MIIQKHELMICNSHDFLSYESPIHIYRIWAAADFISGSIWHDLSRIHHKNNTLIPKPYPVEISTDNCRNEIDPCVCGVKMLKCWNVSSPRLPGRHFLLLNETGWLWIICEYSTGFAKLETPSHAPEGRKEDLTWCDTFNQSEAGDRQIWPIRGQLVWETWTNSRAARRGNARKLWSSFCIYSPNYWVYICYLQSLEWD